MIADPLLTFVSGVKLDASGTNLYVTVPSTGVLVFDLSPNGVWHRIQVIQDGVNGVADLSGPYDLALSPDGKNVYVAATLSNALVTFTRDPITGLLTYQGAKINGQGGVVGLSEETSVVVSPNGKYVFVGGGSLDSVVAFSRNPFSGSLTFSQQLVIHSTDPGTSSLPSALSVSDDASNSTSPAVGI